MYLFLANGTISTGDNAQYQQRDTLRYCGLKKGVLRETLLEWKSFSREARERFNWVVGKNAMGSTLQDFLPTHFAGFFPTSIVSVWLHVCWPLGG